MVESLAKLGTVFIKFKKNPAPATFSRRRVIAPPQRALAA